jgi:hypothetical protein
MSLPLTKRNALLLLDELERLIRETPEDEVSPEAFETASRLLASLQLAPGPPPLLQARLASLTGWVETMLLLARHARSSPVESGILVDLNELRSLISASP